MNTLRHNRPLAVAALVLIVALSLVLGTMRSVAALAAKTERVYAKDSDKYGSPKADLTNIVKWAGDLNAISVATDSGDLTPEISALRDALSSPVGQGDKALALYTAASAAYGRITANKDVSEAQRNSATLAAGESDTLSVAATYDTMTVNGDLTVTGGKTINVNTINMAGGSITVTEADTTLGVSHGTASTPTSSMPTFLSMTNGADGAYWAKYGVTDHYIQYGSFSPYIGPYTGDYKTFCCPASSIAGSSYEGISYTAKEWQCKHAVGMSRTADRKKVNNYITYTTTYNSPSERAIFIDGASAWLQSDLFYSRMSIRHENGMNVVYMDGHVEFVSEQHVRSEMGKKMAINVTQSVSTAFGRE